MTNPFPFDDWARSANPALWRLRLSWDGGATVAGMPADRDCESAALEASNGQPVTVAPFMASPASGAARAERVRMRLAAGQRIEARQFAGAMNQQAGTDMHYDDAADDDLDDMLDDAPTDDPAVEAAMREARVATAAARTAEARARIAEHERRRAEADAATRQFSAGAAGPGAQFEALARLLAEQQRAADARMEAMLSRMQPARRGLEELRETLALFGAVRELIGNEAPAEVDGTAAIVREVRQMLPDILGAFARRRAPAPAPAPALPPAPVVEPPPPERPAAPPAVAAGNQIASARVRDFVQRLVQEVAAGADAASVADAMADGVALLPSAVRSPLDAGQWAPAWQAVQTYLETDERDALAPWMESSEVQAWLAEFAGALRLDDAGDATLSA